MTTKELVRFLEHLGTLGINAVLFKDEIVAIIKILQGYEELMEENESLKAIMGEGE